MLKHVASLLSLLLIISIVLLSTELPISAEQSAPTDGTQAVEASSAASGSETTEPTVPTEAPTGEAVFGTEAAQPSSEEPVRSGYPVITSIQNVSGGVQINWDSFGDSSDYRVYYKKAKSATGSWNDKYSGLLWTRLGLVKGNSFLHTGLSDGETGIYTVRGVGSDGSFTSDYNHTGWENRYYAPPVFKSISSTVSGVKLTWERSEGAGYYRVYRKTTGGWTRLIDTKASEYTDIDVVSGTFYTYTLRILDDSGAKFISYYLSGSTVTYVAAPEICSVTNTSAGAEIIWNSSPGAEKYRVYYKTASGWSKLDTVSETSYTDTSVKNGEIRLYTVRCVDSNGAFVSGFYSSGYENTYYKPPVIRSVKYSDGDYTISWSGSSSVSAYEVYRIEPGSRELVSLTNSVRGDSFTDNTAVKNHIYAYAVCAVNSDGYPLTAIGESSLYYLNGTPLSSTLTYDGGVYRFDSGEPVNGFYVQNNISYYYKNGKRVDQNWYKNNLYKDVYNRTEWLYELLFYTCDELTVSENDSAGIFELAVQRGIIGSYTVSEYSAAVNRLYAARTLVKALGYKSRSIGKVSDTTDASMLTAAYYGYFIPDNSNKLYPSAKVTAAEFDSIISELRLYKALRGKSVVTFGDSIVYGAGSSNQGIAELIGQKYGMKYKDYSYPGAVMGMSSGISHIADQVRKAVLDKKQADLIILNGGTNDVWHTDLSLGTTAGGYDMSSVGESDFTGGMQKTMWLISENWSGVPVIYLRTHKVGLGSQSDQKTYGERGLYIARKWHADAVDLYNDSGLDGTRLSMVERYTFDDDEYNRGIHPNALGYAKYYLPFISNSISHTVSDFCSGDADGDGEATVNDATLIRRCCVGLSPTLSSAALLLADVDGSGEADIVDASFIQRWLVKITVPYVIGR